MCFRHLEHLLGLLLGFGALRLRFFRLLPHVLGDVFTHDVALVCAVGQTIRFVLLLARRRKVERRLGRFQVRIEFNRPLQVANAKSLGLFARRLNVLLFRVAAGTRQARADT